IQYYMKHFRAAGRKPRLIITNKLRSYGAAKRIVMPGVAHRQHRYLNNRAENSHQSTREREGSGANSGEERKCLSLRLSVLSMSIRQRAPRSIGPAQKQVHRLGEIV